VIDKAGISTSPRHTARHSGFFRPPASSCARSVRRAFTGWNCARRRHGIPLLRARVRSRGRQLQLDGKQVWSIHFPRGGHLQGREGIQSCAVTVAPDGSIFVADGYGSNYVLKFDKDRKFVKAFGGPGEAEGKFKTCHGIALDTRPGKALLLVCNRNNNRVNTGTSTATS